MTYEIFRLLNRHRQLDDALRTEQQRRLPHIWRLQRLRRLKHAVKERLNRLMAPPLASI
ncbi:hypothetical protein SLG_33840 [Sphingobium sp. SYK-6]|uniref:DUF465 domain-containing protein n=1 Tax=Sphingobium sp. (strain NBRC 103272 / SYK-6) TaxID=627192 RepID=UPI0002277967|nr:DUF465 domain-containing protein [Sphingobium sp. SYK-6]BAK68059.1 hypothetical protein SLG_33840 [Sphingobium sp. SYK-6]